MTCACQANAYEGRADHVWPPFELGWAEVPFGHDEGAERHARMLLGQLPVYHYADEPLETGLYRFFKYETPIGEAVGALKFIGQGPARALLLGQAGGATVADWVDSDAIVGGAIALESGGAVPEDNSAVVGSGGTGGAGVHVTPAKYASVGEAAVAMNNALKAHGYRRLDQPIYAGFQLEAGGLVVDAFPGTHTMDALRSALAALSPPVPLANVPIYPWLATTASGLTGQAAYDGVNAPTWAQWTGQATTPAVATASAAGSGGLIAAVAAVVVVAGGVLAKTQGLF